MTGVFKRERRERFGYRDMGEEDHMKTEAEVGANKPRAKERLGVPETGRSMEGVFPRNFRGKIVLLSPSLGLVASRTENEFL